MGFQGTVPHRIFHLPGDSIIIEKSLKTGSQKRTVNQKPGVLKKLSPLITPDELMRRFPFQNAGCGFWLSLPLDIFFTV